MPLNKNDCVKLPSCPVYYQALSRGSLAIAASVIYKALSQANQYTHYPSSRACSCRGDQEENKGTSEG